MQKELIYTYFKSTYKFFFILMCFLLTTPSFICAQKHPDLRLEKITSLQVPPMISQDRFAAAPYVVMHFFDPFPFSDTALLTTALVEQALGVYVRILADVSEKKGQESLQALLKKASVDSLMQRKFIYSLEYVLKNAVEIKAANTYMETVLGVGIHSPYFMRAEKERMENTVRKMQKNKVGTTAVDLELVDLKGGVCKLYSMKSPYILLVFSNPDCPACSELRQALQGNSKLLEMIEQQQVSVVNIYLGEELDKWQTYAKEYPSQWLYLRDKDQAVYKDDTYYVPAIPSMYLLDKDKKVVLKDASYILLDKTLKEL